MDLALACLISFLAGSVPFAWLVVRGCKGVDPRSIGSGNVGATNGSRAFERRWSRLLAFLSIYLLDAAKGFAPAFWGPGAIGRASCGMAVGLGALAILGHVFTPFLGFRGGKGVATTTGVLMALDAEAAALSILVFFAVRAATGQVFLGSLALGFALPALAIALHPDDAFGGRLPVTLLAAAVALFLVFTHRSNLRRLFRGEASA
ncbi:MAG: glycerol-3-phosphate 1-O-acyltransferase PlsY [Planctomycetota bacterium]